jgi:hypothetical protein
VVCGAPANRTYRKVQRGGRVVVGGAEIYEARCRRCFDLGRRARPVAESNGDLDGPPKSARVRRPHPARRRV